MKKPWHILSAVIVAAVISFGASQQAEAGILAQWVELGPDGSSSVRAITDDACPSVIFDSAIVAMGVRSEPTQKLGDVKPAQFPVRGCEVAVPAGSVTAMR